MAGGQERILRRRIRTVQSTRKITKAMELIAASQIVRAHNSGALRATERLVAEHQRNGAEVTVWSVGKKAPPYFRFRGVELAESFAGFADRPEFADARHIAAIAHQTPRSA